MSFQYGRDVNNKFSIQMVMMYVLLLGTEKENPSDISLKINIDKTKILVQTKRQRNYGTIDNIEKVYNFKYFGTILEENGTEEAEIRNRLIQANKTYFATSSIFRSKRCV